MWVVIAIILILLIAGEAIMILPDKMPWHKEPKKKRW